MRLVEFHAEGRKIAVNPEQVAAVSSVRGAVGSDRTFITLAVAPSDIEVIESYGAVTRALQGGGE